MTVVVIMVVSIMAIVNGGEWCCDAGMVMATTVGVIR